MADTQPSEQFAAASQSRSVTLPSGKTAAIRRGKGRDLMRAQRAVAGNPDPTAVVFALIAELAQIDGAPIVYRGRNRDGPGRRAGAAGGGDGSKFSRAGAGLPSAGGFAGLVRFGFGVGELAAMEFEEIEFWMAAVADYNRAADAAMGACRDNRQ